MPVLLWLIILIEDMYITIIIIDQFSASITDRNAPRTPSREITTMNPVIIFYFIVFIPSNL